jgi:hypothetical protein
MYTSTLVRYVCLYVCAYVTGSWQLMYDMCNITGMYLCTFIAVCGLSGNTGLRICAVMYDDNSVCRIYTAQYKRYLRCYACEDMATSARVNSQVQQWRVMYGCTYEGSCTVCLRVDMCDVYGNVRYLGQYYVFLMHVGAVI